MRRKPFKKSRFQGSSNERPTNPSTGPRSELATYKKVVNTLNRNDKLKSKPKKNLTRHLERYVDDPEPAEFSDEEEKNAHAALLNSVLAIGGAKPVITQRAGADVVSEFASDSTHQEKKRDEDEGIGQVDIFKLLKPINSASGQMDDLISSIKQTEDTRKLPAVEKTDFQKTERDGSYQAIAQEVNKWQSIVEDNRRPDTVQHFPLQVGRIEMKTTKELTLAFKPRNQMESEIQLLLKGPDYNPVEDPALNAVVTPLELRQQRAMSLAGAREDHQKKRVKRLRESYEAAKNARQNKIKSKSYHRHQKQIHVKEEYMKMEALRKSDPDSWKDKAERIEKSRVEERMTQRHKKNSFANKAQRFGKYNEKMRDALEEMHSKATQLRKKPQADKNGSSESEYSDVEMELEKDETDGMTVGDATNNPWIAAGSKQKEVPSMPVSLVKPKPVVVPLVGEKPKPAPLVSLADDAATQDVKNPVDVDEDEAPMQEVTSRLSTLEEVDDFDAGFVNQREGELADKPLTEAEQAAIMTDSLGNPEAVVGVKATRKQLHTKQTQQAKPMDETVEDIDINKVMKAIPSYKVDIGDDDDESDNEYGKEKNKMNIAEAFVDDDIIEEFEQRREEMYVGERKRQIEEDSTIVPGWGHWSGEGLKPPTHKRKKLDQARLQREKELSKELAVKKQRFPNAIVNHEGIMDLPIAKYQVRPGDLNTEEKKARLVRKMARPLGRDWVPEYEHLTRIQPNITFTTGALIHPMSKDMVMGDHKKEECVYRPIYTSQYKLKDSRTGKPSIRRTERRIPKTLLDSAKALF